MDSPQNLTGQRVAIYARYSSDNQREASIEDQVRGCRAYLEQRGGDFRAELVFADYAISGASLQRPAFEKMMSLVTAKPRTIDVILTEDISRITRNLADGMPLLERLGFLGVSLVGVADGIDTSARGAKMNFTLKNLLAEMYLDELREKTLRGLEGRALAGYSTGGLPYGYRSSEEFDAHRRVVGHAIEIDEAQAEVVRRVYDEYLAGQSFAAIATAFNREDVAPPRAHSAHRRKGWVASTVRSMLHNKAYLGEWSFKKREWRKVPGTNKRRPRERAEGDVLVLERPHLRIIESTVWDAVQLRLRAVRDHYCKTADGQTKGRSASGRATPHLLSGLLVCACCNAPMVITGGNPSRYYGCTSRKYRGTCANRLSVREDLAQACFLARLRARLSSAEGLAYVAKRLAERMREIERGLGAEIVERRARLARTEQRIRGLITLMAEGDRSSYVVEARRDAELQARQEKQALADLESSLSTSPRLPSPEELTARVFDLEARITGDAVRGREELRRLLKGGEIRLTPHGDHYVARVGLLPAFLLVPQSKMPGQEGSPGRASYSNGCGGRI